MSEPDQYEIPDDCRYSKTDEWVRVDDDGVRIGITDYAQSELSDVTFVELPSVGDPIEPGESFGAVESVKAVSELIAPLSGEVIAVNEDLEDSPELVNEDPYGRGWIICVSVEDLSVLDSLMQPKEYLAYIEERSGE